MIKALIFDMDGVILDSEPFWRLAEIKIFNSYNIPMTEKMCRSVMGLRIDDVVNLWLKKYSTEHLDSTKIQHEIINEVKNLIQAKGKLLPGVKELMQKAKKKQINVAIASSSYKILIETVIEKFKLKEYIDVWLSSEDEEYGKPHPAVYLSTAKKIKIKPTDCLVIEDSYNGLIAAIAARMKTLIVPDSENYYEKRFIIADIKLKSLTEFNEKHLE